MKAQHQISRRDLIKLAGMAAIGLPAANLVAATAEPPSTNQPNTSPNDIRIRQSFRDGVRRFQDAEAHTEVERCLVPRDRKAQCSSMNGDYSNEQYEPSTRN
jgi:hypothetical protein